MSLGIIYLVDVLSYEAIAWYFGTVEKFGDDNSLIYRSHFDLIFSGVSQLGVTTGFNYPIGPGRTLATSIACLIMLSLPCVLCNAGFLAARFHSRVQRSSRVPSLLVSPSTVESFELLLPVAEL